MKALKVIITSLLCVIALILPFAIVICAAVLTPPQYSSTFVGALDEKYDRLHSVEESKIVVVGGSSVAFGLDSKMLERYTGMPVVNFGLYAALGTKLMLDLSRSAIGEGDVVVVSPELDPQTLSLYFSSEETLLALDDDFSMIWDIPADNKLSLFGGMWSFAAGKLKLMLGGTPPNPDGVYNSANFNEYGDLVYPRDENIMDVYYDENTPVNLTPETVSPDFIDYLNDYIAECERRGARVLFAYCPTNELAVVDRALAASFHEFLSDSLDCEIIGSPDEAIMEAGYFYDTNFHLNDAGAAANTVRLTRNILFALGIPRAVDEETPDAPALPDVDVRYFGEDDNAGYFLYEKRSNGSYKIVGLTEEGRAQRTLTIPLGYNTYKVTAIASEALVGAAAETVVITEDTNLRMLENGCFSGAVSVKALQILYPDAASLAPPADFSGTSAYFRIYVPGGSDYDTNYNWVEVAGIKKILVFFEE